MEIRLPSLGEDADSGSVVSIFVKTDDQVERDDPIIELESEKAVASVPSPAAGRVAAVHVSIGDEIRTGALLITLDDAGGRVEEQTEETPAREDHTDADEPALPQPPTQPRLSPHTTKPSSPEATPRELPEGVAPGASPTIRKIARDLGIDLTRIPGTARGGRIVLGDLRDYIRRLEAGAATGSVPERKETGPEPASSVDFSRWGPVETLPASAIRRTIASRMADSWRRVPHVTQFDDADITRLDALRRQHAAAYKAKGARLTLTPVILRALVGVLGRHALVNSSFDEDSSTIVIKKYVHIGLAVDTDAGLIVPVIRNADRKSVFELAREIEELSERARQRKANREDLQGGTFTVSNQGGIGGGHFTPIINHPEVAILGIGRGRLALRPVDGRPEARLMLPLALSHDHRVVDGADGVRFLVDLVSALEEFPESDFELR